MNRPDPAKSKMRDLFAEIVTVSSKASDLEKLKNIGPLLFEPSSIYETDWKLDQILRELCVRNHITEQYFNEMHKLYSIQVLGKHPTKASNDRNNMVKSLRNGHITAKRFIEAVVNVLDFKLDDLRIGLIASNGDRQIYEFHSKKPIDTPHDDGREN